MAIPDDVSRRRWLQALTLAAAQGTVGCGTSSELEPYSVAQLRAISTAHGYEFSEERLQAIQSAVKRNLTQLEAVRQFRLDEGIEPATVFVIKR